MRELSFVLDSARGKPELKAGKRNEKTRDNYKRRKERKAGGKGEERSDPVYGRFVGVAKARARISDV